MGTEPCGLNCSKLSVVLCTVFLPTVLMGIWLEVLGTAMMRPAALELQFQLCNVALWSSQVLCAPMGGGYIVTTEGIGVNSSEPKRVLTSTKKGRGMNFHGGRIHLALSFMSSIGFCLLTHMAGKDRRILLSPATLVSFVGTPCRLISRTIPLSTWHNRLQLDSTV